MRRRKINSSVESLDAYEFEEEGFIEGDLNIGTPIASFNFGISEAMQSNSVSLSNPTGLNENSNLNGAKEHASDKSIRTNQFYIPNAKGLTPPIDGESFSIKRGYQLRPSTLRKLNELKSKHPDVNVYLNTILDEAILHYYNYILNENGHFSL
jgi:hypothetical protein